MRRPPSFRLRPPPIPENDVHVACAQALDRLLLLPAQWTTFPAGHIRLAPAEAARLSRAGLKRGWPDILVIFNGLIFGIEIKRVGGKLSRDRVGRTKSGAPRLYEGQVSIFPRLEAAGMAIATVHSVDELLAQLRRWGLPLRPHY